MPYYNSGSRGRGDSSSLQNEGMKAKQNLTYEATQAPIPTLEPSPTPTLVSGPTLTVESTLENENLDSIEEAAQKMNDFLDGGLELSLMNEEDWLVDEKGDKVGFGWSRITAINWKDFGADEIMLHFGWL